MDNLTVICKGPTGARIVCCGFSRNRPRTVFVYNINGRGENRKQKTHQLSCTSSSFCVVAQDIADARKECSSETLREVMSSRHVTGDRLREATVCAQYTNAGTIPV